MLQGNSNPSTQVDLTELVVRYMHSDWITLREDSTAAEAINQLRTSAIGDKIVYLYVVNNRQQLVGVVPVRKLVSAPPDQRIESLMLGSPISISPHTLMLEAGEVFLRHRLLALPVIDEEKQIVGVIDVTLFAEEMLNLERRHHTDNLFQLMGMHLTAGRRVTAWNSFRDRFPWLLCNIASGLICAFIAARYEPLIGRVAILAMFLTLVLALGESVSMQSMTLTLQHLARRHISWKSILRRVVSELRAALLLGLGCSAIVFSMIGLGWHDPLKGLIIGCSLLLSILTACLLGATVPALIRLLRVDPKVAAGPIVLAAADVMTLLYYFGLMELCTRP